MRAPFVFIAIVATGYLGWSIYREWQPPAVTPEPEMSEEPTTMPSPAETRSATAPQTPPTPQTPTSPPAESVRPGVFYVLERVSVQTPTGVKALNPGEEVRLMYRNKNGTVLVTDGRDEFTVRTKSLTQDPQQVPGGIAR